MATYFVASGGSNTAPYDTWAKAATSLATALAAATADGDLVVLQYNAVPAGDAELTVDTTYTAVAAISLICASNDGGSSFTPTAMGTANWIGNSTTNRSVVLETVASKTVAIYGLTIRTAGSTADSISMHVASDLGQLDLDTCYLWGGNTSTSSRINFGGASAGQPTLTTTRNCTLRFGNASQSLVLRGGGRWIDHGSTLSSAGSIPTTLITFSNANGTGPCELIGTDLSQLGSGSTLFGDAAGSQVIAHCRAVELGASATVLASQTVTTKAGIEVYFWDCKIGTTSTTGHWTAYGSMTTDTSVYYTSGAAAQSWKVVTTSVCSAALPFFTPWVDWYNTGTSSVTPRLEILRDGSASALTDAQVWGEFGVRETASTPRLTMRRDRAAMGVAGTNQAAGAGAGSWTGEGGTVWSGKVDTGAAVTPNAAGRMIGRVGFAVASETVYINPEILTA